MPHNAPILRAHILKCARLLSDEINHILEPHGLNYSLWQVLYVLHLKESCTSIDIAEYLNISKPSVTKRVKILQQMDFFQQIKTNDKRQKKLTLSAHGQMMYQMCYEEINQFEQEFFVDLDRDALLQTKATLDKIIQQLQHMKGATI